jgi:hypothetical protein
MGEKRYLKPCPFCGCDAEEATNIISCSNCSCVIFFKDHWNQIREPEDMVVRLKAELAEANGLLDEIEEQWFNNRSRNFLEFGGKLTAILAKRKEWGDG